MDMCKDGSMALHIATVENLAEKCRRCGDQISDMDIITKLLDRIPVEYSTVHVAMTLAGENRQNLDTVKRLLLSEELRLGQTIKDSGEALHIKKDKQAIRIQKQLNTVNTKIKKTSNVIHAERLVISSMNVQNVRIRRTTIGRVSKNTTIQIIIQIMLVSVA